MSDTQEILDAHIERFYQKFKSKNKQPRDKDWRVIRLAVRDVILGWVTSRLQAKDSVIEIDVFMTYNPFQIPGWSGTKYAMTYILSQAYKTGSSMGIRFTNNVEDGMVPLDVIRMAEDYGVFLKKEHIEKGVITPREARHLYIAITEFSQHAAQRVMELSVQNKVSPERICYMVHHQTYSKDEMESILLGTEFPEHILLGKITPEEYLLYQDVVLRTRDAVLGGMLDRVFVQKEVLDENGRATDLEGNDRQISISFDPRFFAKIYETQEDTPVRWIDNQNWTVGAGERLAVLVRARDVSDFEYYFHSDLEALIQIQKAYSDKPTHFFLLVPRNIRDLNKETLEEYRTQLANINVQLMISPESVALLDKDVINRLKASEVMRHDMSKGDKKEPIDALEDRFDLNTTEITMVAIPRDLVIGRLSLENLTNQAVYDELELKRGVNKHNVRARYHLGNDRMQFLAHQALSSANYPNIKLSPEVFPTIAHIWSKLPARAKRTRLLPIFWLPEQFDSYQTDLKQVAESASAFEPITEFLNTAKQEGYIVIAVQNKHAKELLTQKETHKKVSIEKLTKVFQSQFVPDDVADNSGKEFSEIALDLIAVAVRAAYRGQPHGLNISEFPHMVITEALHSVAYEHPEQVDYKKIAVNITYTDGSQARPFPLFCLKPRQHWELKELRTQKIYRIGMLSQRHPEMDNEISQYWLRNLEISQSGLTNAEVDEIAYQKTLEKLEEIRKLNRIVRIHLYQTGMTPPLIGFLRALVEFLRKGQGKPPILEVTPMIYIEKLTKEDMARDERKLMYVSQKDMKERYAELDPWH